MIASRNHTGINYELLIRNYVITKQGCVDVYGTCVDVYGTRVDAYGTHRNVVS